MDIKEYIADLENRGIALVNQKLSDKELLLLAEKFGIVLPDDNGQNIQVLTPRDKGEGVRGSFGYKYGLESYPYHTDTAFWTIPARYLILKSEYVSACDTYYLSFQKIFEQFRENEMKHINRISCILDTYETKRLTSFRFKVNNIIGYRYDPNIIQGYSKNDKMILQKIDNVIKDLTPLKIEWTGSNFVILDNWLGIHARSNILNNEKRILKRLYIQ